jgi:DNA-binding transcriptional regulator GbsR (MarR family)
VQFSHLLGQPKFAAEIYGLLFVSPRPLSMDETMDRLQMSKGSILKMAEEHELEKAKA